MCSFVCARLYQGQGLGKCLLAESLRRMKQLGVYDGTHITMNSRRFLLMHFVELALNTHICQDTLRTETDSDDSFVVLLLLKRLQVTSTPRSPPRCTTTKPRQENGTFEPFIYKMHYFTKTGAGQT